MTHFVAKISKFVNYFTICLFSSSLYHNLKTKIPCTLHPFCHQAQWEWAFEWGAYPSKGVHPPYTPYPSPKNF